MGKAWEMVVLARRCGRGRWAVAVEVIMLPLGTMTWTAGFLAEIGWWCNWGVHWWKCAVAPLSALKLMKGGEDIELQKSKLSFLLKLSVCVSMVPPVHLRHALQRSVLPPNLLLRVVTSLWPSFLRLQVVLLCQRLEVIPWEWQ